MSYAMTTPPFLMGTDDQDVGLFPTSSEWTVSQAAKLLDMSEACVNNLLDLGILEFRQDGGRRLLQGDRLLEYEADYRDKKEAMAEITQWTQEMGLYDD